jgi:hypothetical protein
MQYHFETRERFRRLQQSESSGELSESEAAEFPVLRDEQLAAEAEYLLPAAERLGEESAIIERQNQELEALLRHKSMLAQRLERVWSKPKLSEKPSRASGRRF